jgi:hypothetical protein
MKKTTLLILVALLPASLWAQWVKVVDEKGEPIPYVSIQFASSQRSYLTNVDGLAYVDVDLSPGEALRFRHIAYESREWAYEKADTTKVTLKPIVYDLENVEVQVTDEKALFQEAIHQLKAGIDQKKQLMLHASYGRFRMKGKQEGSLQPHFLTLSDGLFFSSMPFDRTYRRSLYQTQYGAHGFLGDKVGIWVDADSGIGGVTEKEIYQMYRRLFAYQLEIWNDALLHLFSLEERDASDSFAEGASYLYRYEEEREGIRITLDVDAESGSPRRLQLRLLEEEVLVNNFQNLWLKGGFHFQVDYSLMIQDDESLIAMPAFLESKESTALWKPGENTYSLRMEWDYRPSSGFFIATNLKEKDKEDFFLGYNSLDGSFDEKEWKESGLWDALLAYAGFSLKPEAVLPFNTFLSDGRLGLLYPYPSTMTKEEDRERYKRSLVLSIEKDRAVLAQIPR